MYFRILKLIRVRYFAEAAYLGTNFHGWQVQDNATSIQGEIERVLSLLLRETIQITGSGRTDTGVHAYQQFFHFDVSEKPDLDKLIFKMNALLHQDVVIKRIQKVKEEAHARFDATKRSYVYRVKRKKDPFSFGQTYQYNVDIDLETMNLAAKTLLGEQDFKSFSKVKTNVNNFFCNVFEAHWFEEKNELKFYISANRFLRGMVRAIVGSLLLVGEGKISVEEFRGIISEKNRKSAGRSVPPEGLFLLEVSYPEEIFIKE